MDMYLVPGPLHLDGNAEGDRHGHDTFLLNAATARVIYKATSFVARARRTRFAETRGRAACLLVAAVSYVEYNFPHFPRVFSSSRARARGNGRRGRFTATRRRRRNALMMRCMRASRARALVVLILRRGV